ncbi:hypothetical protein OCF56_21715 [Bacillus mycoides]|uniref:hypothetical protein n=1 Tax=Bacillus mycoides TaxID=1405 RepID=UPI0021CDAF78|nr:hypothetical protein [Bacillus mycoides]MCU5656499.1 hypothetical protein [Bacillus mycoides]
MKLHKVVITLLCSILFLSACSSLSKEEYIDTIAKNENEAAADISKAGDLSLTLDERKLQIDKAIKTMRDTKEISPPDEFKSAHEEYKSYVDLATKEFEKVKEKLNDEPLHKLLDEKTYNKAMEYNYNFKIALGSEWKEKFSNKID